MFEPCLGSHLFRQFGQIFAELLPSNFAKLQPPEGKELTDGLEVKVRLGQVWKQSLTELSGGQRFVSALDVTQYTSNWSPRQFLGCPLPHHGTTSVQARSYVYSGRNRRSSRLVAHTTHWHSFPKSFPRQSIRRCQLEGRPFHKRKRPV